MRTSARREHDGRLSILPIMNLVSILIPFLLMTAQFAQISAIETLVPVLPSPGAPSDAADEPVTLLVQVGRQGVRIVGADAVFQTGQQAGASSPPIIPCKGGVCAGADSYDWAALTRALSKIKDAFPEEDQLLLLPDEDIPYEAIVRAMDASRADPSARGLDGRPRPLFPRVVLASGPL
jgi:biopolymer transport protein ExbD